MNHTLFTSAEIERLLQSARSGQPEVEAPPSAPKVEPFDFQGAGQLTSGQIIKLVDAHAEFANRLGRSLSVLLGSECMVTPAVAAQMAYGDLVQQFPAGVCFGVLHIQAPEGRVVVQSDPSTVLPMIDLLLGGAGSPAETPRPLTEIEVEVFKPVIELFGGQLQALWGPVLETSLRFEHHGAAAGLFPANERVLLVKFQIHMGDLQGAWTLILPSAACNAFIPKSEQELPRAGSDVSEQNQIRLKEKLLDSRFRLELYLPSTAVSMRKLAHLKPGQVVALKLRSTDPIHLNIAGINIFQASPVSCGALRGAQIERTLSIVKSEKKETE